MKRFRVATNEQKTEFVIQELTKVGVFFPTYKWFAVNNESVKNVYGHYMMTPKVYGLQEDAEREANRLNQIYRDYDGWKGVK